MISVKSIILYLFLIIGLSACQSNNNDNAFKPINGFSEDANKQLEKFLQETKNESGRNKIGRGIDNRTGRFWG